VRDVVESHEASSTELTVESLADAERAARRQADLRIARR
jgi:1-deoxy-D-xylulose-5-phosphate reductoisomerase